MKFLVVVDMQNDFIDGALGTAEAKDIVPYVLAKIHGAIRDGDAVFVTMDTHGDDYLDTREGKLLPVPHCIRGSEGWQLNQFVRDSLHLVPTERLTILEKPTFGAEQLPAAMRAVAERLGPPDEIEFVGLCTGICVISNAMLVKAAFYETEISVDAACCACVTPQSHQIALAAMKTCQITVKNEGKEPWWEP